MAVKSHIALSAYEIVQSQPTFFFVLAAPTAIHNTDVLMFSGTFILRGGSRKAFWGSNAAQFTFVQAALYGAP